MTKEDHIKCVTYHLEAAKQILQGYRFTLKEMDDFFYWLQLAENHCKRIDELEEMEDELNEQPKRWKQ